MIDEDTRIIWVGKCNELRSLIEQEEWNDAMKTLKKIEEFVRTRQEINGFF